MKRLVLLLCGCLLLAGCAHEKDMYDGGALGAVAYPYGGLSECTGYAYAYDPYDPYLYSSGFGGPCRAYDYRYYSYPYSYSQANQRQQITKVTRSNHTRVVGPRSAGSSPSPSSSSSSISSSIRATVVQSSSSPPATHTVPARR